MVDAVANGTSTGGAPTTATTAASTTSTGTDPAKTGATDGTASTTSTTAVVTGAPEKYADFKLPDGVKLEATELTDLQTYAKANGFTQVQAQAVLDRTLKTRTDAETSVVQKQQEAVKQLSTDWKAATQADAEIGGDKLTATLATAVKARDAYGSPELIKILNDSGMGNHPEVVRFFAKVGAAMSEDKHVQSGKSVAANTDEARAARMYPSMVGK